MSDDQGFVQVKVYLPKSLYEIVRAKAKEMKEPMSKVVSIAVDNELDSPAPFNYPCVIPNTTFVENAYLAEAQRIVRFLENFPKGVAKDTLVMSRRDMGIINRDTFMLAMRELWEAKIITECAPPTKIHFSYPPGYKYIKLKNISQSSHLVRKRRMKEQLEKEIAAEEARLAEKKEKFT